MRKLGVMIFGLLLFAGLMVLGVVSYVPEPKLISGFTGLFSVATGVSVFSLLLVAILAAWIGLQIALSAYHKQRARRGEALQAHLLVQTAPADSQVFAIHLGGLESTAKALHLSPAQRINGPGTLPTDDEVRRWAAWQMMHSPRASLARGNDAPLLTSAAGPVDLLTELDNVQRCLIVGPSNTGKTTLLKHVMARRLGDSRVVAVDPHSYAGKWPAHKVFGVGRDYGNVEWGLLELLRLMERRYDDIGRGVVPEMGHSKITLLVDEWRAIVQNVDGAGRVIGTLLTESRKAAFSVFVATHSERVKALGIEGEGDLKDGFCIVRLAIVNGERAATIDKGDGEQPVRLPGPFVAWQPPRQIEGNFPSFVEGQVVTSPAPAPTEQERQVLDLAAAGASKAQICEQVWGYKSGNLYPEIDRIIAKFGGTSRAESRGA